jgi:hypothetical protein
MEKIKEKIKDAIIEKIKDEIIEEIKEEKYNNKVTNKKTVITGLILLLLTLAIVTLFFYSYEQYKVNEERIVNTTVNYSQFKQIKHLPNSIYYSPINSEIYTRQQLTSAEIEEFVTNIDPDSLCADSIRPALRELQYKSNTKEKSPSYLIFLICGLLAALGTQARSLYNFINMIAYKKQLDIKHFWPWYALRPLLSFIISVLFVLAFYSDSDILSLKAKSTIYLFAINFLVGFAIEDVITMLRNLSKRIFNAENNNEKNK